MGIRRIVPLLLGLSVLNAVPSLAQGVRELPGRVQDANLQEPLRAAIAAYEDSDGQRPGQCPAFADLINRVDSRVDGGFDLPIPAQHQSFTMVVCRAGYFSRVEEGVQSLTRTEHVEPRPIELVSYYASPAEVEAVVERKLRQPDSDMRYLRGIEGGPAIIGAVVDRLVAAAEEEGRSLWARSLSLLRQYLVEGEPRPEAQEVPEDAEVQPENRPGAR